ncbi:replication-relaxation family protein [Bacillus sp. TL12]|uniref:replication-relaxation family protein n=1 Tax=Bacillus sp. TL12 TaxID=2894756 RepID=UPI001F517CDB|nr:replication-relaxation family protein [Bacillus sp. TL12]MCI0768248.1 replication-relaxation family protein [Bacillus sp. TL12]
MRNRDKAILSDLQRFRCMSRDDIIDLHFSGLKNAVTCCNTVMKRLRRDGHVDANVSQQPYIYFSQPSAIRKTSQKIPHFLGIVDLYKQLVQYEQPKIFDVEPRYGKEFMEPDAFTIWHKSPFFIEVQKSVYSKSVMQEKISRYEYYYASLEWQKESWQPKNSKFFPSILMITDKYYEIYSSNLRIFQANSINEFITKIRVNSK